MAWLTTLVISLHPHDLPKVEIPLFVSAHIGRGATAGWTGRQPSTTCTRRTTSRAGWRAVCTISTRINSTRPKAVRWRWWRRNGKTRA